MIVLASDIGKILEHSMTTSYQVPLVVSSPTGRHLPELALHSLHPQNWSVFRQEKLLLREETFRRLLVDSSGGWLYSTV